MDILALNFVPVIFFFQIGDQILFYEVLAYVMPVCAHVIDAGFIAAVIAVGSCFSCFPVYDRAAASSGKQLPTYRAPHHSTEQVDSSGGRMFYIPVRDLLYFRPFFFGQISGAVVRVIPVGSMIEITLKHIAELTV